MCRGWDVVLAVLMVWAGSGSGKPGSKCACVNAALCQPIPKKIHYAKEVLVFDTGGTDWMFYMWPKVTTVVAMGTNNPELLCHAHANGVRVVIRDTMPPMKILNNAQRRRNWIKKNVDLVKSKGMDGLNLHVNERVVKYSKESQRITQAVREVYEKFHQELPGSRLIIEAPWKPECAYGRCYEYGKLANYADYLFVMGYDTHTSTINECFAKSNSPYTKILSGIQAYINLGIAPSKLVMGVPWFGIDYPCKKLHEPGGCELINKREKHPCSVQSGKKVPYKTITDILTKTSAKVLWHKDLKVPSFTYKAGKVAHEVWFDDSQSIKLKVALMKKLKLRGIGVWSGNFLKYSSTATEMKTRTMWNALL